MYHHIPNALTILRIIIGCVLWYTIHATAVISTIILLAIAELSDFFDGYFARRFQTSTPMGVFLDPIADKVLVSIAFAAFSSMDFIGWWVTAIIIARDLCITALRMLFLSQGRQLTTRWLAKCKTVFQFGALYVLVLLQASLVYIPTISMELVSVCAQWMGVITAVVTTASAAVYLPEVANFLADQ